VVAWHVLAVQPVRGQVSTPVEAPVLAAATVPTDVAAVPVVAAAELADTRVASCAPVKTDAAVIRVSAKTERAFLSVLGMGGLLGRGRPRGRR
jgi:hypothetical protein